MTTSLADLLAGVDMEGGEAFCDEVYNFLKNQGKDLNLFTNSGFGVWSQSDANKGLAALVFDNGTAAPVVGEELTGAVSGAKGKVIYYTVTGAWDGSAWGTIYLGAVSGTFQDPEGVTGNVAAALDVNGDTAIGVKNDPMNNDSTGIWTRDAGLNLGFGALLYTVDTNAVNLDAWITAGATLVAGKIYKIELDIKNGSVNTEGIQGYFDDGAAQYGRIRTTDGWASVSWVFECATSTVTGKVGFRIVENLGGPGQNIQIRRFSCYEITPCCTEHDELAFDGWNKFDTLDIYRQHSDGGTLTQDGSFYSLKLVPLAPSWIHWQKALSTLDEYIEKFTSRTVTFGVWIKTSTASHARLLIYDGVTHYSPYHSGGGGWEWLEITNSMDASAGEVSFQVRTDIAGNVDGSTIVYVSQPMLVFGSCLGEGMYQPKSQEIISLDAYFVSTALNGLLNQSDSGVDVLLNLEADTDGRFPKGAKTIWVSALINDAGSAAAVNLCILKMWGTTGYSAVINCNGILNDAVVWGGGRIECTEDGDFYYKIYASAGNTFDISQFTYHAVQVN